MSKNLTESDNLDLKKRALVEALKKNLGIVSAACEAIGISRDTYYRWLKEDTVFSEVVEKEVNEYSVNFVESKLFERINGITYIEETNEYDKNGNLKSRKRVTKKVLPDASLIQFYLKTKGKHLGYTEKLEMDITTGGDKIHREVYILPDGTKISFD